ncbi:MAG: replicative DNA helicase [Ruminococcaceae bacterium]|nr:replicative DNA helicase [Oscillospiraceae bacterium]
MDKQLDLALGSLGINEPYSIEAEQAILGAALISPETVSLIIEQVRAEYFYSRQNQKIFLEIHKLFNANMPSDFITVLNSVIANGVFTDEAEAKVYLTQLAETVPSLSNVSSYAKILKDKYLVRMLLNTSTDIIKQTQNASEADVLLEYAEQKIYELRQGKDTSALSHIGLSAAESFDRLRKLSGKDREKYLGIPTGFSYLDKMLTGLGRSDLVILAARPGMGKTSFVLNIATNVAKRGMPVAVFSLEMTKEQLTSRIISAEAHIDSQIMRSGNIQVDEWDNISRAVGEISDLPIYLDDTSNVSVSDIKAKIRRLNQDPNKENVGLVVIDYLQLMSTGKRNESRVQEISEITRNLKIMAKELNVPLICLSQLSRSAEKGQGRDARPALSDLRDSGSIEQDADVVLFLYRDAYYSQDEDVDQTKAECIVAKNRHGEVGKVYLGWDGAHTRFYNIDFVHEDE